MTEKIDADKVDDRQALAAFVEKMHDELLSSSSSWGNSDLISYLEAMSRWIRDMPALETNTNQDFEAMSKWKLVAIVLDAARVYE